MNGCVLKVFLACLSTVAACDPQEITTILQIKFKPAYFIIGIDQIYEGSFNKTLFFELLRFENTSRSLPLVSNSFKLIKPVVKKCNELNGVDTMVWWLPTNTLLFGIIYGCSPFHELPVRIFVYNNPNWNRKDEIKFCSAHMKLPPNYLLGSKICKQLMNDYVRNCQQQADGAVFEEFRTIIVVFILMVILYVTVYFIDQFVRSFFKLTAKNVCPL